MKVKVKVRDVNKEHGIEGVRFSTREWSGGRGTKTEKKHIGGELGYDHLYRGGKTARDKGGIKVK